MCSRLEVNVLHSMNRPLDHTRRLDELSHGCNVTPMQLASESWEIPKEGLNSDWNLRNTLARFASPCSQHRPVPLNRLMHSGLGSLKAKHLVLIEKTSRFTSYINLDVLSLGIELFAFNEPDSSRRVVKTILHLQM